MLKLINGETFFGLLKEETDNYYLIEEPKVPIQNPGEGNTISINFLKWVPYKDKNTEIKVNKNLVITILNENDMDENIVRLLRKEYYGIEVPDNNVINLIKNSKNV